MIQMQMGGSERLVHSLVSQLDRKIFNPSIAWFFGDKVVDEFERLDVPLYHVPKLKRFDFSAMRMLGEIIRRNDIQVVNAHHFMSFVYSFYGCKVANRIKLLYTEHSCWEIETIPWRWKKTGQYLLQISDGAIGVSPSVSKGMQEIFRTTASKSFSIQNGVNLDLFQGSEKRSALRKSLKIADNEKVIGIVANLKKVKNHLLLLQAFHELIKEIPDVKLILIGKGFEGDPDNEEPAIRDFVAKNDLAPRVLMLGARSDVPVLLSVIDLFCLTSFKEGLPISLIEAMAAGLPVVGTDVSGIRDVIVPGKNGFLVQLGDVAGIKDALKKLLLDADLRDKMGKESKKMASEKYSMKRCIHDYQNLFLSMMNN